MTVGFLLEFLSDTMFGFPGLLARSLGDKLLLVLGLVFNSFVK